MMNKQEVNLKSGGRACYFVAKVSDFGNAHRVSPIYFNRERAVLQLNYLKKKNADDSYTMFETTGWRCVL
ncbi:hypothetical protein [Lacticaseibacillus paracasei]|uniref:hypothetical protein n=2 Tax=Lacticaseibacillus paracasei TaxID=1597 RepID=UPI002FF4A07E